MKKVLVLMLALVLSACAEPRIDASSDEALKASFQRVRKSLDSADREALDGFMGRASVSVMMSSALGGGITLASNFEALDGMTGQEAAAFARQLEAENDAARQRLEEAKANFRAAWAELEAQQGDGAPPKKK